MSLVEIERPLFWAAAGFIAFNPLFWNVVGRYEHHTRSISRLFGSKYVACYVFAISVFTLGIFRDYIYTLALAEQPRLLGLLGNPVLSLISFPCFAIGSIWVLSSMYRLGVIGTYLGDYFGILMKDRIIGFPFNQVQNPMYHGASLLFFGHAIINACPAGVLLSGWAWICYMIALRFEEPFTAKIYAADKAGKANKAN